MVEENTEQALEKVTVDTPLEELVKMSYSPMPDVFKATLESPVLCPICTSQNIEQIHNSSVILNNDGTIEAYFHIFCHDCWKEFPMMIELLPPKKFCTCSTCNKLWEGKERHEL